MAIEFEKIDYDPFAKTSSLTPYGIDEALKAEGITGAKADFIKKGLYAQESSSGKNTATSNAGAVGGMQITPIAFKEVANQDWKINNPEHNMRSGVRYASKMFDSANGDVSLASAGYYGGPNGMKKASQGIAISDPRNPNAPDTLGYAKQVLSRLNPISSAHAEEAPSSMTLEKVDYDPFAKAPLKPKANENKPGHGFMGQLGLTGRYALEGAGSIPQMIGAPLEAVTGIKGLGGNAGQTIADAIGLPTPNNALERVVGGATRTGFSAASGAGLSGALAPYASSNLGRTIAGGLAANPTQQIISGIGAGGAGDIAKESGAGPVGQLAAAVAGGVATPLGINALAGAGRSVLNGVKGIPEAIAPGTMNTASSADSVIGNYFRQQGIDPASLPQNIIASLRDDVAGAIKVSGNVSGDALNRLIAYKMTGATPTKASLTLNPSDITMQKNLAKVGMNSRDASMQQLGMIEGENTKQLIGNLNQLGAGNATNKFQASQKVIGDLQGKDDLVGNTLNRAYNSAKDSTGRSAMLDHVGFTNKANDLLDKNLLGGSLPGDVRNMLNGVAKGEIPFTVDVREQMKTAIGKLQRNSSDGSVRMALSQVRTALDDASILNGQSDEAAKAFNVARRANRMYMNQVERTPALQAVRDGVEPDKFMQQYILGDTKDASVSSLKNLISVVPDSKGTIREQMANFLKGKALNNAEDEVGKFSATGYNKALKQIGDEKLGLFFNPTEIQQLKAVGKVASYEKFQPDGSAVNNSNTAGAGIGMMLDKLAAGSRKVPFLGGKLLAMPVQSLADSVNVKSALNTKGALALPNSTPKQGSVQVFGLPAGLLNVEQEEEQKKKKQKATGLLSP